ncbi:ATP synthase F1 subunit delta [Blautia sp.]|uniref:ATP synthase subunit delta n=1 Tax=Blautia glucerasea TaxID=536633 RepID=A0A6N2RCH4_9FIRM
MTQTARVYGGSLYELAVEEQLVESIGSQMEEIRQIFWENPDYMKLLCEPSIPWKERILLVDQAFGEQAEKYLVNFIKILCERNILREYGGCCEEFRRRYNADRGIAEAVVTGAVLLNDAQMEALKQKLEKISGRKISLSQKTDPSVVAGLRVELEGKLLDGTVQGRLSALSRKLDEIIV